MTTNERSIIDVSSHSHASLTHVVKAGVKSDFFIAIFKLPLGRPLRLALISLSG